MYSGEFSDGRFFTKDKLHETFIPTHLENLEKFCLSLASVYHFYLWSNDSNTILVHSETYVFRELLWTKLHTILVKDTV